MIGTLLKHLLRPMRRRGAAFARDERGATAIEFGILALPFFTIIFAIIETSMVFFAGQVLDSAVQDASRKVRTGEASAYTLAQFRTEICNGLFNLFRCSDLKIVVKPLTTFSTYGAQVITQPIVPNCTPAVGNNWCWQVTETYQPGATSSIELVQVFYKWPTIINFGGFNLQNQTDQGGSRLLSATRVFQNEPF
jgi:Flp pilus assembly protein TadG